MPTPFYRTEADRLRARAEYLQEEFDALSSELQSYIVDSIHEGAVAQAAGLVQDPATGEYR